MGTYRPATKGYYGDLRTLRQKNPSTSLPVLKKLAGMGQYVRDQDVTADMYENPEQMLEDMQARQEAERANRPQPPAPRPVQQPMFAPQQHQGASHMIFGPAEQYGILQNMANGQMAMISKENDSRVAQEREWRRMQHEKEMMQMQAENSRKEREGDMIRQILASM